MSDLKPKPTPVSDHTSHSHHTSANEPDAELSELVENFEKMKHQHQPPRAALPASSAQPTLDYVHGEIENLRKKQALVQEQIDTKTKEVHTLRETLLVVNGALQGMEHIRDFILDDASSKS